ncbi:MAG TPA: tyrosine--tRNA ligase [Clostridia bacterium]|nr:tyrosine--tRNA ligase [Clostridia bacterium]
MKNEKVMEILMRNAVNVFSEEGLRKKLESGKPLKVKFGADPSRPDLHLGHTVPLRMLKVLQEAGHQIIFVIGDFTGMIGDPSGKSKTRNSLSFEETRKNGQTYFEQVAKVLDPKKTQIVYNSEWLGKMDFADVLNLAGKYTLARIMERDDFSSRYSNNQPIGIHELLYPLIQGYDSVAINADIEIGGTDQTFNLLVGRELQKDYGQEPQEVITFPLIAGLDGIEKMSKSLDNYIGINESAETIFEKCMKIPDNLLNDYFRLTTDIPEEQFSAVVNEDIREGHMVYARKIIEMYHGKDFIKPAEDRYISIACKKIPHEMKVMEIDEDKIQIIDLLRLTGYAKSNSEARRLIEGNAIKIDGDIINDINYAICNDSVICRGKSKFVRIRFKKI